MPAAVLTEAQQQVLKAVCKAIPYATVESLSDRLRRHPSRVQHILNALTRRGFVTPMNPGRAVGGVALADDDSVEVYVCTAKGHRYV